MQISISLTFSWNRFYFYCDVPTHFLIKFQSFRLQTVVDFIYIITTHIYFFNKFVVIIYGFYPRCLIYHHLRTTEYLGICIWVLSGTVKSLRSLPYLKANMLAWHGFMDSGKRHGSPGSETKILLLIAQQVPCTSCSWWFLLSPKSCREDLDKLMWVLCTQ